MAATADVKFIFDTSSFKKGFATIGAGFNKITTSIKNKTAKISSGVTSLFKKNVQSTKGLTEGTKAVSSGVFSALTKFALLGGAIIGAFSLAKGVLTKFVPEIGVTLGIAKDIFFRNLLFPLRKFLLPILNKILDWTRRNRAAFVKWGAVLVNIFKVVIAGAKLVFNIVKGLFTAVVDSITAVFGKTTNTITEIINVVIFKLATLFAFLEVLLAPAFKAITEVFTGIVTAVKTFASAFIDSFTNVFKKIGGGMDLFGDFGEIVDELLEILDLLAPAFKLIGTILGGVFATVLAVAINQLKTLVGLVKNIILLATGKIKFSKLLSDVGEGLKESKRRLVTGVSATVSEVKEQFKGDKNVNDALITKDGKVIKFNPNDNIIATQGPVGGGVGDVTITFGNTIVQVTEGNAEAAGQNFIRGAGEVLRESLIENLFIKGSRL